MLTLSAAMTTTQKKATRTPYITVTIVTSEPSTTEAFTSAANEVIEIELNEGAFGAPNSTIKLNNADQSLSSKDYTGRRVRVAFGYDTSDESGGSSTETEERGPLFVIKHDDISEEGQLVAVLTCGDIWDYMSMFPSGGDSVGDAPGWNGDADIAGGTTKNIEDLINDRVLSEINAPGFSSGVGLTVDDSDTIIDGSFKPKVVVEWGTAMRQVIIQLMTMTKSGLRMRAAGMRSEHLDTDEAVVYTFGSDHEVEHSVRQQGLVLPNRVIVVDATPVTQEMGGYVANSAGTANDSASQTRFGVVAMLHIVQEGTDMADDTEASNRADAILHQIQQAASVGTLVCKPNIGLEVHDRITVNETSRAGFTFTGFVTAISWKFRMRSPNLYLQEIRVGGATTRLAEYLLGRNLFNSLDVGEPGPPGDVLSNFIVGYLGPGRETLEDVMQNAPGRAAVTAFRETELFEGFSGPDTPVEDALPSVPDYTTSSWWNKTAVPPSVMRRFPGESLPIGTFEEDFSNRSRIRVPSPIIDQGIVPTSLPIIPRMSPTPGTDVPQFNVFGIEPRPEPTISTLPGPTPAAETFDFEEDFSNRSRIRIPPSITPTATPTAFVKSSWPVSVSRQSIPVRLTNP